MNENMNVENVDVAEVVNNVSDDVSSLRSVAIGAGAVVAAVLLFEAGCWVTKKIVKKVTAKKMEDFDAYDENVMTYEEQVEEIHKENPVEEDK